MGDWGTNTINAIYDNLKVIAYYGLHFVGDWGINTIDAIYENLEVTGYSDV